MTVDQSPEVPDSLLTVARFICLLTFAPKNLRFRSGRGASRRRSRLKGRHQEHGNDQCRSHVPIIPNSEYPRHLREILHAMDVARQLGDFDPGQARIRKDLLQLGKDLAFRGLNGFDQAD